ncbi:MAG: UDP-N-acetylmuramoyl-L-alanyl-D-glutamate--2,6-diaminopimelate ligase [Candidatus Binatia bacterium]
MLLQDLVQLGNIDEAKGNLAQAVTGLAFDSRQVKKGDVFFAVNGERYDGHAYAAQALEKGAAAVVVARRINLPRDATWVLVQSARATMGRWAAEFFGHPSRRMRLVGVTGTNGKTTVTYLLESIFSVAGMKPGVIGTINYRFQGLNVPAHHTTPESIELHALLRDMADAGAQSVAMEVSSHSLSMERVRGIDFDGAVFTNLSRDHLDFHGDMEAYFGAKRSFFTDYLSAGSKNKKFAVIHGGDPRGRELLEELRGSRFQVLSYGSDPQWDIHPEEIHADLDGMRGALRVKDQKLPFSSRLVGDANLENIMAAAGVGFAVELPLSAVAEGIARLESVPGRLEKVSNSRGLNVLVDYAHTPDALEKVLSALRPLTRSRLLVVFGCGGDRDRGKRPVMGEIAARLADLVILTSDNPRSEEPSRIVEEIEIGVAKTGVRKSSPADLRRQTSDHKPAKAYFVEPDRRAATALALQIAAPGDTVLVAGKGHEDYQILGTKRIHFDDREVARAELERPSRDA